MTYEKLSFPTSSSKPSTDFSSGTISYLVTLNPASSFSVLLTMSLDKLAPSARYENKFSNPKSSPCLSLSPSTPVKYLLSFVPFMAMLASCYTKTTAKEAICLSQQSSKKKLNSSLSFGQAALTFYFYSLSSPEPSVSYWRAWPQGMSVPSWT